MQIHPPLIELLGGQWSFAQPVAAAAWSADGRVAAFGLGDGAVMLARAEWDGGPRAEATAERGIEVRPPSVPNPPLSRVVAHKGACVALVADCDAGFLSGGDDGRVVRIGRDGAVESVIAGGGLAGGVDHAMRQKARAGRAGTSDPVLRERGEALAERPIALLAAGPGRWRACAAGAHVVVTGPSRHVLTLPSDATALAFDRDGDRLAAGYRDGIRIWSHDQSSVRVLPCGGRPRTLAWDPEGVWLAVGLAEGGVRGWRIVDGAEIIFPAHPPGHSVDARALSFSADGRLLAASGAPRVLYWRFDPAGLTEPSACGLPSSRAPVCAVAWHPGRPFLAAGYASGLVLLCQPGSEDVLFVKRAGGGRALSLAWSPDGRRLALATEGGEAGVVLFPDGLFRAAGLRAPTGEGRAFAGDATA